MNKLKNLKQNLAPLLYGLHKIKPILKGVILVILGVIITRQSVGIGRLNVNFIYSLLSYFLIGLSGLSFYWKIEENISREKKLFEKKTILQSLIFFTLGLLTIILAILFYNLNWYLLIFGVIIEALFLTLAILYLKKVKQDIIKLLFSNLIFSIGILYGALFNTSSFPFIIVLFFLAALFLQFARDLIKYNVSTNEGTRVIEDPLRKSQFLQICSAAFLILAIFFEVSSMLFYLYPLIITIIFFSLDLYFTNKIIIRKGKIKTAQKYLKITVYLQLLTFLLAT